MSESTQGDAPEIRKYRKKFNSEILCAALWGIYFKLDILEIIIFNVLIII